MRLFHVTDALQAEANASLRAACEARGVTYLECVAGEWDETQHPGPGDALYFSAVAPIAKRLEQALHRPGVATFYANPTRVHRPVVGVPFALRDGGVPIPRTLATPSTDPDRLRDQVRAVGGYPVVLKVPGGSDGVGVLKVETPSALRATLEWLYRRGSSPYLLEWFPLVRAHRTIVVGDRVVFAYAKVPAADDFRTNTLGSEDEGVIDPVPEALETLSLAAARACGIEFGGADILEDADGRMVVTEINFPCLFSRPEKVFGADVTGPMIDWLKRKAERLAEEAR